MHIQLYSDDGRNSMSDYENVGVLVHFCSLCFQRRCAYLKTHLWFAGVCAILHETHFPVFSCFISYSVFICFNLSNHLLHLHHLTQSDFSIASEDFLVMG